MFRTRVLATALALCPATVLAAGFEVPDNGALVVARGGTTAALIDTAYGVSFNPAGLSLIDGLDIRLDYRFVNHAVSFQREATETDEFMKVENSAGVYAAPFITAAYGGRLGSQRFGVGLGVFGPPGIGRYQYARPGEFADAAGGNREINARTGHRYATFGTNTSIIYPSLALSYAPVKQVSFGVTLQPVYASISLAQSMAALANNESHDMDVIVGINVKDTFSPTAVLGALWEPTSKVRVHASFRPKVELEGEGPLDLEMNSTLQSLVTVSGNKTTRLNLALPPLARLGASYDATMFTASAELVYEGWGVNKQFVLTPDVMVARGTEEPKALDPVIIEKEWKDSYGARVGGTFKALRPKAAGDLSLDVHAGGLFESNAIPSTRQSLDYVTGDRLGGSVGVSVGYQGFSVTASAMGYLPVKMTITDSKVSRASAEPEEPVIVGNGEYTSNVWLAAVGISYTGLGSAK